mgnify:CR=1 FL=1
MKKLFFFLFFSNLVFSQTNNSLIKQKVTYNSLNGYTISNPLSSIYDENGWLWILGENKLSSEFVIGDKEIILQRFDGNNFFTLKIPFKFKNKITRGALFKNSKGGLYLKLWFDNFSKSQLFFIDVESLQIEKVLAYDALVEKRHVDDYYYLNNSTRFIVTHQEKLFSAEINGLHIKMLDSIKYDNPNKSLFINNINTFGNNAIVKLLSNEFFLLDEHGKFVKMLTKKDFVSVKGNPFLPTTLYSNFTSKGEHYFYFDEMYNLIKYNKKTKKFVEQNNVRSSTSKTSTYPLVQEYGRIAFQHKINNEFKIDFYDVVNNSYQLKGQISLKNRSIYSFRDLKKDIAFINQNELELYFFNDSKIQTFLKDKSIRSINQLSESKYMIATDSEGFYEVDVKNDVEKEIHFLYNNKIQNIDYSREIIVNDSLLITNDLSNIYFIDKNYKIKFINNIKHPSVEFIKVGDTIFAGGQYGKVYKYSIKGKTTTELKNTINVLIKEFATNGKVVFATSSEGLFKYEKGRYNFYKFENVKVENLLSIKYTKEFGVLVTTKFGEIYQFNQKNNTLNLFYKDELKASIVGIVVDNNKKIWLNTYAGIVSYNPKNKQIKRYTKKDGIYELEGNRFSTFKDKKGNIFIGSYKGVSFFNPKDLEESSIKIQLIFSSISSYNVKSKEWETMTAPNKLRKIDKLILPASNQRFTTSVSVLGIVNPNDIKYRYRLLDNKNKSNWIRLYSGNEILFSNLAAGEYTLQVEALTLANQKIGETLELKIVSEIVFYKSWWFILSLVMVLVTVVAYIANQFVQYQKLQTSNKIAVNEAKVKEVMMLEIHHRIKNNLQVVSGLLGLQALNSTNKEVKSKLKDSQGRIESIAGIHNILYNSNNQEFITVKEYFNDIISYNQTLFPLNIAYSLAIDHVNLNMDKAIPLALILNELVNNSYKHAFKKQNNPKINITFKEYKMQYVFTYSDNGNFKEKRKKETSMGMKIVAMMIEQLEGKSIIKEEENFHLEVFFSKEKKQHQL